MGEFARPVTSFLFATPSFLEGFARLFDFGNTLVEYNWMESGQEADGMALRMDWAVVGQALYDALDAAEPDLAQAR